MGAADEILEFVISPPKQDSMPMPPIGRHILEVVSEQKIRFTSPSSPTIK